MHGSTSEQSFADVLLPVRLGRNAQLERINALVGTVKLTGCGQSEVKVAYLKADMPPKEQSYEDALNSLFKNDE